MSEFGFDTFVGGRKAIEAAEKATPAALRYRVRPRRVVIGYYTDRATGEIRQRETPYDPVPSAVSAALIHNLHGLPLQAPGGLYGDEVERFWQGIREHQRRVREGTP